MKPEPRGRVIELLCKLNASMKALCMESYDSITVHPKVFWMIATEISPFLNQENITSGVIEFNHAGHKMKIIKGKA